jgi:hypothetical protein
MLVAFGRRKSSKPQTHERRKNMGNEIVPMQDSTALAHLAAVAARAQETRLLKFVKGKFYTGDDEVPTGRPYVAHVSQLNHGWLKFSEKKVTEQRIGAVADGFVPAKREELGNTDPSAWEKDCNGTPRDPWFFQYYLPLEDMDTGELLTFATGTLGGKDAIGRLCSQFVRNARNGLPIIRLIAGSYKHKSFGRVEVPDFSVIGWTGAAESVVHGKTPPTVSDDMNDEIPF